MGISKGQLSGAPQWQKVTKTYSDLSTAGLTNNITVYTLAANEYIHDCLIVPTVAASGGIIASYTLSLGITGALTKYLAHTNVFTGFTLNIAKTPITGLESISGTTAIKLSAISTVGLLNAATAGSFSIYILTSIIT